MNNNSNNNTRLVKRHILIEGMMNRRHTVSYG